MRMSICFHINVVIVPHPGSIPHNFWVGFPPAQLELCLVDVKINPYVDAIFPITTLAMAAVALPARPGFVAVHRRVFLARQYAVL